MTLSSGDVHHETGLHYIVSWSMDSGTEAYSQMPVEDHSMNSVNGESLMVSDLRLNEIVVAAAAADAAAVAIGHSWPEAAAEARG